MRACVLPNPGDSLRIERLRDPVPGPGEVLIRVAACGVCHTDLHVMKAEVAFPTPCVLGHEVSGTVVETGAGVDSVSAGDRVATSFIMPCGECAFCWRGEEELCERFFQLNRLRGHLYDDTTRLFRSDGTPIAMYSMAGLAELAVVPTTAVFPLPDALPLNDSAILGCAMLTAYGAIRHVGDVRPGDTVAVVAAGGVGSAIVQLARLFGARTIIAIDIDDEKLIAATNLGATHVVNSTRESVGDVVREITAGRGVDVAFEALGHPTTFTTTLESLRDGGRAVVVGIAAAGLAGSIPLAPLTRRKISIHGSYGARPRTDMPVLIELAAAGRIDLTSMITKRFPLEETAAAYDLLDKGKLVGRTLIEVSPA